MRRNILIKVDVIGGTSIDEAVSESLTLSKQLNIGVEFSFNGVHILVFPSSDIADKIREYDLGVQAKC